MELKAYQKHVIADLKRYMELLRDSRNYITAFRNFWEEQGAPVLGRYHNLLPGVPNLCFKVPTGGGKTFLACSAIKPIFDALPPTKTKAVVWLVPSDAILTQTAEHLKDPYHPYRQKINVDFGGRVEVYTKEELLNGQNFSPTTVMEQLSVMVLSYDSFRSRGKEGLKAYQENSNLAPFARAFGEPEVPIEKADATALFQVVNQLNPVVIVDESHHARTELSLEMLKHFNPCFVLDLTATPKQESNIVSYVDAMQLKREHMVKLPVIVYNRNKPRDVLVDAIDLRRTLEKIALAEYRVTGRYIRPIALLQAQPRGKEEAATFEKIRELLVKDAGIPAEQIAIRTAENNELKAVDLLSPTCPIRYIITVNALKEGWDCPFAYILASLANRTSRVDVEQILGRVLRQPYTCAHQQSALNMAYVLTSSADFNATVEQIVVGLNYAGFSRQDYRLAEPLSPAPVQETLDLPTAPEPASVEPVAGTADDENLYGDVEDLFLQVSEGTIGDELGQRQSQQGVAGVVTAVDRMLGQATAVGAEYEAGQHPAETASTVPPPAREVQAQMDTVRVCRALQEDVRTLNLPQFMLHNEVTSGLADNLFGIPEYIPLDMKVLAEGFSLKSCSYSLALAPGEAQVVKLDLSASDGGVPKAYRMNAAEKSYLSQYFDKLPKEARLRECKAAILRRLNQMNLVSDTELSAYVARIVNDMTAEQTDELERNLESYAERIRQNVNHHIGQYCRKQFEFLRQAGKIVCRPNYRLPAEIHPNRRTTLYPKSLYQAEEEMNQLERDVVFKLSGLENVRWWHRNIARTGFCINGFINHYPDLIVMTKSGKTLLVETKGAHLDNADTHEKMELGEAWQAAAGQDYRYFMVFSDEDADIPDGALNVSDLLKLVKLL